MKSVPVPATPTEGERPARQALVRHPGGRRDLSEEKAPRSSPHEIPASAGMTILRCRARFRSPRHCRYHGPVEAPIRFRSLDAWRGVCALCVALLHLNTTGMLATGARALHAGRLVDFFFVLSG